MIAKMHPMQVIELDEQGTPRFVENKIVVFLLHLARKHGIDLNDLAVLPFDDVDRMQFTQLCGYTVCGYGELYPDDASTEVADGRAEHLTRRQKETKP